MYPHIPSSKMGMLVEVLPWWTSGPRIYKERERERLRERGISGDGTDGFAENESPSYSNQLVVRKRENV